jgi:hypothetical protein
MFIARKEIAIKGAENRTLTATQYFFTVTSILASPIK